MSIDIYGLAQGQLVELISERDALRVQLAAAERDLRTLSLHMGEVCAERDTAQRDLAAANARAAKLDTAMLHIVNFFKIWYACAGAEPDFDGDNSTQRLSEVYETARAARDGQAETGSDR